MAIAFIITGGTGRANIPIRRPSPRPFWRIRRRRRQPVFIGAPGRDVTFTDVGAVYSTPITGGVLFTLIANPVDAASAAFGSTLTIVGGNLAIGSTGATSRRRRRSTSSTPPPRLRTLHRLTDRSRYQPRLRHALAAYDDTRLLVGAHPPRAGSGAAYLDRHQQRRSPPDLHRHHRPLLRLHPSPSSMAIS